MESKICSDNESVHTTASIKCNSVIAFQFTFGKITKRHMFIDVSKCDKNSRKTFKSAVSEPS